MSSQRKVSHLPFERYDGLTFRTHPFEVRVYHNPEHAFGGRSKLLELIERIYSSAQDAALWPTTLAAIAEAVCGESIAIYAGFPDFRTPDLHAITNCPAGAWEEFSAYYATINPIMESCSTLLTPGRVWVSNQAMPNAEFEKTEFYNDFYSRYDMYFSLGFNLHFDGSPSASLSCQRPRAAGTFSVENCLVLETLMPHLNRALKIHHKMSALQTVALGMETALDRHDHAVIGIDGQGKVCLSNPLASELLSAGDGIYLAQDRLHCVHPKDDVVLQGMLASHILGMGDGAAGSALLVSRSARRALHICLMPLRRTLPGQSPPLTGLLLITDPQLASSRATVLKRLFGVTPSEARVADLLLQGLNVREISDKLKTTPETTRFQVKQLLGKTGTRRQAELIRLVTSLPGSERRRRGYGT